MQIASKVAGFTLAQADLLRRAMSKKKTSEMKKLKEAFIEGATKKGVSKAKAVSIMNLCEKFAEYGFNKSHSAAYAVISYQTAWLKAHFPVEYLAALLSSVMDSPDKVPQYAAECRRLGIAILGPDINQSQLDFTVAPGAIRFGLAAIKNVGEGAIVSILEARDKGGPFQSLLDLVGRIDLRLANKRVIESLIKSGALDSLSTNRLSLIKQLDRALELAGKYREKVAAGQGNLFGTEKPAETAAASLAAEDELAEDFPWSERLALEKAALGLFVSDHPLNRSKDLLRAEINTTSAQLRGRREGQLVKVGGIVTQLKKRFTKQGQAMATFLLEDLEGVIPVVVFPAVFEKCAGLLSEDGIVIIAGRVSLRDDNLQVVSEKIAPLKGNGAAGPQFLHIELPENCSRQSLEDLQSTLSLFRGQLPVYLHLGGGLVKAGEKYLVSATPTLISGLEEIVGRGKVWLAPANQ